MIILTKVELVGSLVGLIRDHEIRRLIQIMCGISGFLGEHETSGTSKKFESLFSRLKHRGPNGSTIWKSEDYLSPFVMLGHHRLAINDLDERANQPLIGKSGSRLIVNGEIYNSPELRQELIHYKFKTSSDSESLLAVLDTYGLEGITKVQGMFAFAYIPETGDALWLGRDRLGIKPLYWCKEMEGIWFSSEAKPLAQALGKQIDEYGLSEWGIYQFQISEKTFYRDILSVKPGTVLVITNQSITSRVYWSLEDHLPSQKQIQIDPIDAEKILGDKFNASINSHLLSDVPIATLTSGGMDSSWVSSLAAKRSVREAYIGRYPEAGFDESHFALAVAEKSNLRLNCIDITGSDFFQGLKEFGRYMDFPGAGPGAVGQFLVSKSVARDFRVVLSGTGGDELFLGYTRDRFPLIAMGLIEASKGMKNNWGEIAGDITSLGGYGPMYTKFAKFDGFISPLEGFLAVARRTDSKSGILKIHPEIRDSITSDLFKYLAPDHVDSMDKLHDSLLRFEIGRFLPSLLQVEDRVTMACGLESRVPMLGTDVLEFMISLPLNVRLSGSRPKDLMRAAAINDLPNLILSRKDKMGFPVPLDSWSRSEGKEEVFKLVSQLRERNLPFIHNELLDEILQNPGLGNRNLWACLTISTWLNNFEE
jgi:asparagine synthase (glutamine-hydrolysing)